jgi:hypothetical protein
MVPAKALWGWAKPLIVVSADAEVLVEHHLGVVVRDDGAARTREVLVLSLVHRLAVDIRQDGELE